jgi:RNA polymerase sigma-70 factor (ECF subfamily)
MLRSRAARREQSLSAGEGVYLPDPIVTRADAVPEEHALLAESVGIALLVVLDTLPPAERLAFVLHDVFALPFDQIGSILDRSPAAAKQLASRARRRLRGAPAAGADAAGAMGAMGSRPGAAEAARQRRVLDAFRAAAEGGDFAALLTVLDPDVVLRADNGTASRFGPSQVVRGAEAVAGQARRFAPLGPYGVPVTVNGGPGVLVAVNGEPYALLAVTVVGDAITEIDILADPARLALLDLPDLLDTPPGR